MTLLVRTPFGSPVAWADVAMGGDRGDGQAEGDGCCVVVSGRRLGRATANPLDDFLLCVVADAGGGHGGRVAQAAFVESFLANDEIDVLWRLRDAVKAADGQLANRETGPLSSCVTALFLAGDGTAYGVSVGDCPLVVGPPRQDPRVRVLGREQSTALGTGETLLADAELGNKGIVEQWWPDMNGDGSHMRLTPGTCLELGGRGVGSTQVGVHFNGGQVSTSRLVARAGWLVSVVGQEGDSAPDAGGVFALACLADETEPAIVPGFVRALLELDRGELSKFSGGGLETGFRTAGGDAQRSRLAVVVRGPDAATATFATGGASAEPTLTRRQPGAESSSDRRAFTLRLGPGADPLDRGIPVEFQQRVASASAPPRQAEQHARGRRRWAFPQLAAMFGRPRPR